MITFWLHTHELGHTYLALGMPWSPRYDNFGVLKSYCGAAYVGYVAFIVKQSRLAHRTLIISGDHAHYMDCPTYGQTYGTLRPDDQCPTRYNFFFDKSRPAAVSLRYRRVLLFIYIAYLDLQNGRLSSSFPSAACAVNFRNQIHAPFEGQK